MTAGVIGVKDKRRTSVCMCVCRCVDDFELKSEKKDRMWMKYSPIHLHPPCTIVTNHILTP